MVSYIRDRYFDLLNLKKNTILNQEKNTKNQKGGKLLGEGGFGCVISPPLRCKKTFNKTPYSIDSNYISKIVEYDKDDEDIWSEINIGDKILKIDTNQKYFTPIMNGCFLYKQNNGDLKYSRSKPYKSKYSYNFSDSNGNSNKSSDSSYTGSKSKKSNKCNIYMDEKYLNLISKYAGINLEDVFESKDENLLKYIDENYKTMMHHLCKGLLLLKKNNILHCDIKTMNLMVNYNKQRNKAAFTFIDFGLSYIVNQNKSMYELSKYTYHGTDLYKPLEILIISEYLGMIYGSRHEFSKKTVLNKVVDIFKHNRKYYISGLNFNRFGVSYNHDKNLYISGELEYGNKNDIMTVFKKIHELYENRKLIDDFTIKNSIFKWDVFSLGIVFAELMYFINKNDETAYDLISKMVHPFYWERYTIEECLEHPFFKSSEPRVTKKSNPPKKSNQVKKTKKTKKPKTNKTTKTK